MSTTDSRGTHAVQRPLSQPACTLAPVGNSHSRQRAARADLITFSSSVNGLLRPAERLTRPPYAMEDYGELPGERDACLPWA